MTTAANSSPGGSSDMPPDDRLAETLSPLLGSATDFVGDCAVVVFGTNNWDEFPQTRQHIAGGLAARGWPVTYTTGPHFIWDLKKPKWRNALWRSRTGMSDGVVLDFPGRWLLRWNRVVAWDRYVCGRYVDGLTQHAGWHDSKRRIAYVFHPIFWPYVECLGECLVVYHADDSFSKMPNPNATLEQYENDLVERADLIIASSPGVAKALPGNAPSRARVLENGADVELFISGSDGECPPDLAQIPRPRIGYCGHLNPKVDFGLIAKLALYRPEWHWVFIGNTQKNAIDADPISRDAKETLDTMLNVHFLGARPHRDIPSYQANMDINVLCYRTDPGGWWEDLSPLKLFEYLAVGRPVIGAALEVLQPLQNVLVIANDLEEWLAAIESELDGVGVGSPGARRSATQGHSWDAVVSRLEGWIMKTFGDAEQD